MLLEDKRYVLSVGGLFWRTFFCAFSTLNCIMFLFSTTWRAFFLFHAGKIQLDKLLEFHRSNMEKEIGLSFSLIRFFIDTFLWIEAHTHYTHTHLDEAVVFALPQRNLCSFTYEYISFLKSVWLTQMVSKYDEIPMAHKILIKGQDVLTTRGTPYATCRFSEIGVKS